MSAPLPSDYQHPILVTNQIQHPDTSFDFGCISAIQIREYGNMVYSFLQLGRSGWQCFFSAEISVRSPRKIIIHIIYWNIFWVEEFKNYFNQLRKQKHWRLASVWTVLLIHLIRTCSLEASTWKLIASVCCGNKESDPAGMVAVSGSVAASDFVFKIKLNIAYWCMPWCVPRWWRQRYNI